MSEPKPVKIDRLWGEFPPVWPDDNLRAQIAEQIHQSKHCVVTLDDDPTGTQTMHDIWVVTTWEVDVLRKVLSTGEPSIYLLIYSRILPLAEAQSINRSITRKLVKATRESDDLSP